MNKIFETVRRLYRQPRGRPLLVSQVRCAWRAGRTHVTVPALCRSPLTADGWLGLPPFPPNRGWGDVSMATPSHPLPSPPPPQDAVAMSTLSLWHPPLGGEGWKGCHGNRAPLKHQSVGLVSSLPFCPPNVPPWSWDKPRTCPALSRPVPRAVPAPDGHGRSRQARGSFAGRAGPTSWETFVCHGTGAAHVRGHRRSWDRHAGDLVCLLKEQWKREVAGCAGDGSARCVDVGRRSRGCTSTWE